MKRDELLEKIKNKVEEKKEEIINALVGFIKINSVNPRTGGPGEREVAEYIEKLLEDISFEYVKRYDAKDDVVEYGYRPNIVAKYPGENSKKRIWFITHMDTVPVGDEKLWNVPPFGGVVKDGKIYGRGSEDNGSSLIATLFAVKILHELGIKPKFDVLLSFVSDEETGSEYGIKHLVKEKLFEKTDWVFVPDLGTPKGDFIEVAEKSILWLKITTYGKQYHASMPDEAINAHRYGMKFALEIDELINKKYANYDPIFLPPHTTFEPTKKLANVDNVNTIPGSDVIFFDGRFMPTVNLSDVMKDINEIKEKYEKLYKVKISVEEVQKEVAAPPTSPSHQSVLELKRAIEETRDVAVRVGGIGGGTCAAIIRKEGIPAVVWGTSDGVAHQVDEYIKIEYLLNDVITYVYFLATVRDE